MDASLRDKIHRKRAMAIDMANTERFSGDDIPRLVRHIDSLRRQYAGLGNRDIDILRVALVLLIIDLRDGNAMQEEEDSAPNINGNYGGDSLHPPPPPPPPAGGVGIAVR